MLWLFTVETEVWHRVAGHRAAPWPAAREAPWLGGGWMFGGGSAPHGEECQDLTRSRPAGGEADGAQKASGTMEPRTGLWKWG